MLLSYPEIIIHTRVADIVQTKCSLPKYTFIVLEHNLMKIPLWNISQLSVNLNSLLINPPGLEKVTSNRMETGFSNGKLDIEQISQSLRVCPDTLWLFMDMGQ